jgi:vanillate O-demethylase ferredoxin subunit
MSTIEVRVARRDNEAEDICSYELVQRGRRAAAAVSTAGAHIDVHVAAALVRQYSLCNRAA